MAAYNPYAVAEEYAARTATDVAQAQNLTDHLADEGILVFVNRAAGSAEDLRSFDPDTLMAGHARDGHLVFDRAAGFLTREVIPFPLIEVGAPEPVREALRVLGS